MEFLGYLASGLIGISLGLIGGGGSILTVPVLVYLFGLNPLLATSYSLFVVGSTSLVGAVNNFKNGYVRIKTALLFGITSITTVLLARKFIIPNIPKNIFSIGSFMVTESKLVMLLFAILMVIASFAMINKEENTLEAKEKKDNNKTVKLLAFGIGIGFATGILGAGGGFLLIPTLVILMGLPMKEAVGTSLFIIALNSLFGFSVDLGHFKIDWIFLLKITAIAVLGIFIGGIISKKVDGDKLKKGFGYFVLVMGVFILVKEIFFR